MFDKRSSARLTVWECQISVFFGYFKVTRVHNRQGCMSQPNAQGVYTESDFNGNYENDKEHIYDINHIDFLVRNLIPNQKIYIMSWKISIFFSIFFHFFLFFFSSIFFQFFFKFSKIFENLYNFYETWVNMIKNIPGKTTKMINFVKKTINFDFFWKKNLPPPLGKLLKRRAVSDGRLRRGLRARFFFDFSIDP